MLSKIRFIVRQTDFFFKLIEFILVFVCMFFFNVNYFISKEQKSTHKSLQLPLVNTEKFTFTKFADVSFDYSQKLCKYNLVGRLVQLMEVFIYFTQFRNPWKQDKDQGVLSDQLSLIIRQPGFVSLAAEIIT